jgi:hypothetical protein
VGSEVGEEADLRSNYGQAGESCLQGHGRLHLVPGADTEHVCRTVEVTQTLARDLPVHGDALLKAELCRQSQERGTLRSIPDQVDMQAGEGASGARRRPEKQIDALDRHERADVQNAILAGERKWGPWLREYLGIDTPDETACPAVWVAGPGGLDAGE